MPLNKLISWKPFTFLLRSDAETKRALEELTEKLNEAQKQDVVRILSLYSFIT